MQNFFLFKERTRLESHEGYSVAKLINETKEKIDPRYKNQLRFPTKTFAIIIMSSLID